MDVVYQFVKYGEDLKPEKNTLALDVGMKTMPGVIDHHHPNAEPECTASLIAKYPHLVLDHIKKEESPVKEGEANKLRLITHRFPDFDSISSAFLAIKLIETGKFDSSMEKIATYTKMVDSASLPEEIDLSSTPYSILRALFTRIRKSEEETSLDRMKEGLIFMNFLYSKSKEGYEFFQNRVLFSGIDRYEKAMRKTDGDYFNYLSDLHRGHIISLYLPMTSGQGKKKVDGLIIRNPRSFLSKEWARRDRENSPLGQGFTLLMTNFGNNRYILGVDPRKGVNLKGLGAFLNEREEEKRKALGKEFTQRWYEGNCPFFNFRIVDSPQDVTSLSHEEILDTLQHFGRKLG